MRSHISVRIINGHSLISNMYFVPVTRAGKIILFQNLLFICHLKQVRTMNLAKVTHIQNKFNNNDLSNKL